MALFKILRGNSSNLEAQTFHDGYAYFTPDTGKFYIDATVGNNDERILINPDAPSVMAQSEATAGTATTARSITAAVLNTTINNAITTAITNNTYAGAVEVV